MYKKNNSNEQMNLNLVDVWKHLSSIHSINVYMSWLHLQTLTIHSVYRSFSIKVVSKPPLIKCLLTRWFLAQLSRWYFFSPPSPSSPPHPPLLFLNFLSSLQRKQTQTGCRPCITVDVSPVNQWKRLFWTHRSISCPQNNIFLGLGDKAKVFTLLWFSASSVCFYFVPTCTGCVVFCVFLLVSAALFPFPEFLLWRAKS